MAALSTILLLASAGLGAASAVQQGNAAKKQADFQARVAQDQAARERQVSAEEERDFRKSQSANFAERRAALGKSGVSTGTGSPLLAADDFASEVELQAQRIRAGGQIKSSRLDQESGFLRQAGRNAQQQGLFRGGASLLSGLGQANFG